MEYSKFRPFLIDFAPKQTALITKIFRFFLLIFLAATLFSLKSDRKSIYSRGVRLLEKEMVRVPARNEQDYDFLISPWVTNREYKHYLFYLRRVYGSDYPEIFQAAFPCPILVEPSELPQDYFTRFWMHPKFDDYPVVGLTWKQAMDYAHWRTNRTNEWLYIKAGWMEPYQAQIGDDAFNIEATLVNQYASGLRRELPIHRGNELPHGKLPKGWYLPGFRLPTASECHRREQFNGEKVNNSPFMADIKQVMPFGDMKDVLVYYPIHAFIKANPGKVKFMIREFVFDYDHRYTVQYPTYGGLFHSLKIPVESLYRELSLNGYLNYIVKMPPMDNRRYLSEKGTTLVEFFAEIDSFANSETNVKAVEAYFKQPAWEWLLEPPGLKENANLAQTFAHGSQPLGFNGVVNKNSLLVEKDSTGKMSFQVFGVDEKGEGVCAYPYYLKGGLNGAKAPLEHLHQIRSANGQVEQLPANQSSPKGRIRMVCTPYSLPESQLRMRE